MGIWWDVLTRDGPAAGLPSVGSVIVGMPVLVFRSVIASLS
jgi:hypothetical protein